MFSDRTSFYSNQNMNFDGSLNVTTYATMDPVALYTESQQSLQTSSPAESTFNAVKKKTVYKNFIKNSVQRNKTKSSRRKTLLKKVLLGS
jgi:hypothetical protein